jgi:hypothetical protein
MPVSEPALRRICNLEVELRHWCHHCLLPSAAVTNAMTFLEGKPHGVHRWWACYECFESLDI